MSRRVFSICLALILSPISFALQPLEPPDGDWIGGQWYYAPDIATEGDYIYGITPTSQGFSFSLGNNNMYQDRAMFAPPGARIMFDVTWVASEWDGTNIWAQWNKLALNSNSGWWETPVIDTANPAYPGSWDPYNYGAIHTRRLAWDISGYNWAGVEGSWWLQFNLSTNFGGDAGMTWGNFYIDNVFIPEPATITLLGLGSLALLRRKR